jgi:hypothetical protein
MAKKTLLVIVGVLLLVFSFLLGSSYAEELIPYSFFEQKGMEALKEGNYAEAIDFFKEALSVNPSASVSLDFLNAIKRLGQGRVSVVDFEDEVRSLQRQAGYTLEKRRQDREQAIADMLWECEEGSCQKAPSLAESLPPEQAPREQEGSLEQKQQAVESGLQFLELMAERKSQAMPSADSLPQESSPSEKNQKREQFITDMLSDYEKRLSPKEIPQEPLYTQDQEDVIVKTEGGQVATSDLPPSTPDKIYLNDTLWNISAKPNLKIEMGKSVILEGQNIERHLVVSPGFIKVETLDRDRIMLTAEKRGKTVFLLWESHGRWSFNVEPVFPIQKSSQKQQDIWQEQADPFRFSYTSDWTNFYSDEGSDELERRTLSFTQYMMLEGETPYGYLDSSVVFDKLGDITEATGYSVGLTDGNVGPLSDFTIRGFDAQKTFSPLTLPSKYFRGILWEQDLFDNNLTYTFLTGRNRYSYGYLTPGVIDKQDFYVTGARVQLFPEGKHSYAFNYTSGSGDDRPSYLKDEAMSIETFHNFGRTDFEAELAYAEKDFAYTAGLDYVLNPEMDVSFNFRNIDKEYTTVTDNISRQGEVGSVISFLWQPESFSVDSVLDIYRNRLILNPHDENAYNYDWSTTFNKVFNNQSSLNTSFYYLDTPGLIAPHRDVRVYNTYSKNFQIAENKIISAFLGQSYQRSRYAYSPLSEFDRLGATVGVRVPLFKDLSYYCNYEHYWVEETSSQTRSQPNVLMSGFNYSKNMTEFLSGNIDLSYRNEEDTESLLSFLAGEDSAAVTVGVSYRPNPDFDFYIDGSGREIWPEDQARDKFFEADIRVGVRMAWELPFHWNPEGYVGGIVYKDMNGNQKKDPDEKGIADITLQVGQQTTTTGSDGRYRIKLKAKRAQVGIDFDSLPQGYVFTTPLYQNVEIVPYGVAKADFGLTTQSGVYGVVYYDANGNNKPDTKDELLADVKIMLDGKEEILTDFEGSFSFSGIPAGKHDISFDVNSIPVDYIPLLKIKNEIEIQEGTTYIFHIPVKKNK